MSKEKKSAGRPYREFDRKTFEALCAIHCTVDEIEAVLHTDQRILSKWCQREYGQSFKEIYQEYKKGGKASLRRYQMNLAKKNATMGIWLGRQMLGQRDIPTEFEQFNGKLALLLDTLKTIKTEKDLKDSKMARLQDEVQKEEENDIDSYSE